MVCCSLKILNSKFQKTFKFFFMKANRIIIIMILIAAIFSSCQKEEIENQPVLTEKDRMAIWQLPDSDPTVSIGGLKNSGVAQWSPYPYPYFVVYVNDAFYRRYFVVYENHTYSIYDKLDIQNGEWFVVQFQALIFTGFDLPGLNPVLVHTNISQDLQVNITIHPQYFEGKIIGNLSYDVYTLNDGVIYLLFDGTILLSRLSNLGAAVKWQFEHTQVNLLFSIPSPPNAVLWLPFENIPYYGMYHVHWEDLNGYNYVKIGVDPNGFMPVVQVSANTSADIQHITIMPQYLLDGHSWEMDWSYFGLSYEITILSADQYMLQYLQ